MSIFGFDPTTKWMVQNQGRGILFLGGYTNVRQWKPLQTGSWTVKRMWDIAAKTLLDAEDVGLTPWVPLTNFTESPEKIVQLCRKRIEKETRGDDTLNLLAATQVFTGLRFQSPKLLEILGGKQIMIQSPVLRKLMAEQQHESILFLLQNKFSTIPENVETALRSIQHPDRLREILLAASTCTDIAGFEKALKKR